MSYYFARAAVSGGGSYLVEENFTGAALPSGWTDDATGSWVWSDTTPASPNGGAHARAQDWGVSGAGKTITAQTEFWAYFQFRAAGFPGASAFRMSNGTNDVTAYINSSGQIQFGNNLFEGAAQCATAMSVDTWYHVWLHYKAGTSAGICEIGYSTTGTKPTSGGTYAIKSDCTLNASLGVMRIIGNGDNLAHRFDRLLISSTAIGDNP